MRLTQGQHIVVERVRLTDKNIAIEGTFELPQLARLSADDQVFIIAFVRSHGSIKEMEQVFGVSYPTIKSRLTRIAESLEFIETNPAPSRTEVSSIASSAERLPRKMQSANWSHCHDPSCGNSQR